MIFIIYFSFYLSFVQLGYTQGAAAGIAYTYSDGASTASFSYPMTDAYHNLEKYWYYRYRLVNDFLFIDDADGPNNGYPGTIASTPYGIQRNGYFIRDDVPFRTLLEPNNSIGTLYQHFNRPGLQRTWQNTGSMEIYSGGHITEYITGNGPYDVVNFADGSFHTRWEGTTKSQKSFQSQKLPFKLC